MFARLDTAELVGRTTATGLTAALPDLDETGGPYRIRILAISGSLRASSSNTAALAAAAHLAPTGLDVCFYNGLASLPHFNPDHDQFPLPDTVADLYAQVATSHGLLISSPEYAHGIAGALKNALDWLVGSLDFAGKPVIMLNTSPRAVHADSQLREVLATMAGSLLGGASITLPLAGRNLDAAAIAADPKLSQQLRAALAAFALVADRRGTLDRASEDYSHQNVEGAGP